MRGQYLERIVGLGALEPIHKGVYSLTRHRFE